MHPRDALSPKNKIQVGSITVIYTHPSSAWSLATMIYDGHPALGIRWNGDINDRKDLGYPSARGSNGAWFILPDELAALTLALLKAIPTGEAELTSFLPELVQSLFFEARTRQPQADDGD